MDRRIIFGLGSIVALLCLVPLAGVVVAASTGSMETVLRLADTVLWRYTSTTLALVTVVAIGSIVIGTATAWLVVTSDFFGRRVLEIALALPLTFPAYVLAYAYTDILDHPGIVQSSLRALFGWGPRDYWFPEIRSFGGAAMVLTLVLYPYVYLMARAAFKMQGPSAFYAALVSGASPLKAFMKVSLPMVRPAVAAGALLVIMETIADFGTVSYFSVQTFATGIYTSWFGLYDRAAAAQLAVGLLSFAILIAALEHINRGRTRTTQKEKQVPFSRFQLQGLHAVAAQIVCALPVLLGAIFPVIALVVMGMNSEQNLMSERYVGFIQNSLMLGAIAALVTCFAALCVVSFRRFSGRFVALAALFIARLGYAVPGIVIAVGLLVPFAAFDNWLDSRMEEWFGISTGLLISGSIWLLILAYMTRFLAAGIGPYESGLATLSPNVDSVARLYGRKELRIVGESHVPLLRLNLLTAMLIVFVDTIKELPATLILRPFNYDTLAVQAYRLASDERLEGAAVPSLLIAAFGLLPVIILCRQIGADRND